MLESRFFMLCPCGSERAFTSCCQQYIIGDSTARTPEQLMRSRYSAYATMHANYIYNTYAASSRVSQSVADIEQWAAETKWLKLVIHMCSDFSAQLSVTEPAQVEFSAYYLHQGQIWQMRECSNFLYEDGRWYYLDGNVSDSDAIDKPKRNDSCFCGSSKKFKQCCAKSF